MTNNMKCKAFTKLTDIDVSPEQEEQARTPHRIFPEQRITFATHWHPENVPFHCLRHRLSAMYPNQEKSLIIPTQHNEILAWDDFAGVEVDCYDANLGLKVQLLLHFKADRVAINNGEVASHNGHSCHTMHTMLAETANYRGYQLLDLLNILEEKKPEIVSQAAKQSGATKKIINTVARSAAQLHSLVSHYMQTQTTQYSAHICKNKLIRNYLDSTQPLPKELMPIAQRYVQAVKKIMKKDFDYSNLHPVQHIIEEARALGAGIVIPHPEVFWSVLLAGYDIDGIEVWNPCSNRYTTVILDMMARQNAGHKHKKRLLPFMGDDCHMAEKTRPMALQDPEKAHREIGLQEPWESPEILTRLQAMGMTKESIMDEYTKRLLA